MTKSHMKAVDFLKRINGISVLGFGFSWNKPDNGNQAIVPDKRILNEGDVKEIPNNDHNHKEFNDPNTSNQIEPFFWLAQTLVAWSTSGMEIAYQQFELQAKKIGLIITRSEYESNKELDKAISLTLDKLSKNFQNTPIYVY